MARTLIDGINQILSGSIPRAALNTATTGNAVITKVLAGAGVTITQTGADVGTGDVTINAASGLFNAASVGITGGTINGTSIGATTPSTGAFSTLSASSTVSGTGFTNRFASPGPIGNTSASTGAFSTLTTTGTVSLSGYTTPLQFATIAALRSNSATASTAFVLGFATAGDGGAGMFVYASSDTTSSDNTGTIIVDAASHRWHRAVSNGEWNVLWWGAKVNGATDDTTAIQACITAAVAAGANVYIPPGNALISGVGLKIDHSTLNSDTALVRTSLRGGGPGVTRLSYSGTGTCLTYTGHADGVSNGGVSGYFTISDLWIMGPGSTAAGGLTINLAAWFILRNLIIEQFHYAFVGYDVLSFLAESCLFKWSDYGAVVQYNTFSNPNAITFLNCEFSNNANFGLTAGNADDINLIGCGIQGNGATGSDSNRYGVLITNNNSGQFEEGANGANIVGCYFEWNATAADLWLQAGAEESATFNVRDCTFNRASATAGHFTTNNIRLDVTSSLTARVSLTVQGSAFKGYTPYAVSSARPYIAVNATSNNYTYVQFGNFFYHPTEYPVVTGPVVCADAMTTAWAFFDGTLTGTHVPQNGFNVASITRSSTGNYQVNFERSFNSSTYFVVTGTVNSTGAVIMGTQAPGGGVYINVATVNTTSGAYQDFSGVSIAIYGNGYI